MKMKKLTALLLTALMVLALAACGVKDGDKAADMSGDNAAMTGDPKNAKEAAALYQKLMEQENARFAENSRALGEGLHGGRQGHGHDRGREKLRRFPAGYRRGR